MPEGTRSTKAGATYQTRGQRTQRSQRMLVSLTRSSFPPPGESLRGHNFPWTLLPLTHFRGKEPGKSMPGAGRGCSRIALSAYRGKPFECIKCKINPLMIQVLHSKESLIVFEAIRHIENLKSSFAFFRSRKGCRQLAMNST